MKTVYYLLLGLCLTTAACKPDEPEIPTDEIINGTCGENLTWSYNKTKAIMTISGTGDMEDYKSIDAPWKPYKEEIQTVVIGDSVTSIGNWTFYDCSALMQASIPDGVTSIGNCAFYCSALTQANIPKSVTSIGDNAFSNCEALTAIHVDAANTAYCSENGVLFNKDKTTLMQYPIGKTENTYTIPNGVTSIGRMAFSNCSALTQVTIPGSVTSIGDYAFESCRALTRVPLPESVTSIGTGAFTRCHALTQVTIPNSVTSIGYNAFWNCFALTQVTIGSGVTSIRDYSFAACYALIAIYVDASNTAYCSENGILFNKDKTTLIQYPAGKPETTYNIPDGVANIGDYAFYVCDALTQVTIPNSVTSIGDDAFASCEALTAIHVDAANTAYCSENGILFNKNKTTLICYPAGRAETTYTIPNSVKSIGESAFYVCDALTQVTIPNSVTSIGYWAFQQCSALAEMTVLATVPPTTGGSPFSGVSLDIPVYVPAESLEAYKAAEVWSEFTNLQAIP